MHKGDNDDNNNNRVCQQFDDTVAHIITECLIMAKEQYFNPLKAKRRPLYLKTQFVPRSKHFSTRL